MGWNLNNLENFILNQIFCWTFKKPLDSLPNNCPHPILMFLYFLFFCCWPWNVLGEICWLASNIKLSPKKKKDLTKNFEFDMWCDRRFTTLDDRNISKIFLNFFFFNFLCFTFLGAVKWLICPLVFILKVWTK